MAARKDTQEYRALGLNSRGVAITIAIVGLFLSPALIGIPLAIWGFAADHMLHQHQKEHGPIEDPHVAKPGRTRAQSITYDEKRT
jgi:Na+/glutamate symporter